MTKGFIELLDALPANSFIVEIGSYDGIGFSDIYPLLQQKPMRGLFVEPIPDRYELLVQNYSGFNVVCENAAISDVDGEIELRYVDLDLPGNVSEKASSTASYRNRNLCQGWNSIEVPCMTLDSLFKKHNVTYIDAMVIDTEGMDWVVFNQLNIQPNIIKIEIGLLSQEERMNVQQKLTQWNYEFFIMGDWDIVGVKKEWACSVNRAHD